MEKVTLVCLGGTILWALIIVTLHQISKITFKVRLTERLTPQERQSQAQLFRNSGNRTVHLSEADEIEREERRESKESGIRDE